MNQRPISNQALFVRMIQESVEDPDYIIRNQHFGDVTQYYVKVYEEQDVYTQVAVDFDQDMGEVKEATYHPWNELSNYLSYAQHHHLIVYTKG